MESQSWLTVFQQALARWEIILSQEQREDFQLYLQELRHWNERVNLTALQEPEHIALGHFADSLAVSTLESVFKARGVRCIDIGTGAGFPGLPIKIVNPTWHMTLLESTGKKCDFLKAVVGAMELNHVDVIYRRSEEIGHDKDHRETYDFAFARALSSLSTIIEYALPLLKIGGLLVAHRGRTAADEVTRVDNALQELGGNIAGVHHYEIPGLGGSRALVVIRKDRATTKHYPRRTGVAAKRPL